MKYNKVVNKKAAEAAVEETEVSEEAVEVAEEAAEVAVEAEAAEVVEEVAEVAVEEDMDLNGNLLLNLVDWLELVKLNLLKKFIDSPSQSKNSKSSTSFTKKWKKMKVTIKKVNKKRS